ncbi:MAG TPA: alpha/beta hydrolase [Myxococcales bacterium LLY-WYZ-16_1]|nr:alpha/beta hydrolase [Myxococcales bacterium LLY-WYZ-16_1]
MLESVFDTMENTVGNRFDTVGLPRWPLARLLIFRGGVIAGFDAIEHDTVRYALSVETPALLLNGDEDPRVTPAQARALTAAFGSNARLHFVPGAGHDLFSAVAPGEWREAVCGFLDAHR